MAVTKQDILKDIELTRKVLQEVEFYIRNYTTEDNTEKGVNGVIDYISKILKGIVSTRAINYAEIVNDAKRKGLEREFKTAYSILRQLNFIDYDQQNKLIIIGSRTKYLIKSFTDSKLKRKQSKTTEEINQKKIKEIYSWVLDQINKHDWVDIKAVNKEFEGYQKEVMEAIDKIIAEGKGKLVDGGQLYKVENIPLKNTDTSKAKRIKELKDQIETPAIIKNIIANCIGIGTFPIVFSKILPIVEKNNANGLPVNVTK